MLIKVEGDVYLCSCDVCGAELYRDKRGATKRAEHYCDAKCVMRAVREGKIVREPTTIDFEIAKQDPRRSKRCAWCSAEYVDVTKRNVGKTCSKICASAWMVQKRKTNDSYTRTEEQNAKLSTTLREKRSRGEIKLSEEGRRRVIEATRRAHLGRKWPDHWSKSPEARAALSMRQQGWTPSEETRAKMSASAQNRVRNKRDTLYSSACGGFRADLGQYFRSRWEANFARILNHQGKVWEYEPMTFQLDLVTSYTPDFVSEGVYYELKGRWYKGHAEKVAKFRQLHPEISFVLIEEREYRELSKQYKMVVPGWEGK